MSQSTMTRRILGTTFLILGAISGTRAAAGQLCELTFTTCPDNFNGDTIVVPEEVVALTPRIYACSPTDVKEIAAGGPTSVVFVIDHSGSMANTDPFTERFKVVNMLLDTIHAKAPQTEVALVVFANRLAWDHRDSSIFRKISDLPLGDDSYLPLKRLDDQGLPTLKWALELKPLAGVDLDNDPLLVHYTRQLNARTPIDQSTNQYGPPKMRIREGTDISLGFQAALDALKSSTARPRAPVHHLPVRWGAGADR